MLPEDTSGADPLAALGRDEPSGPVIADLWTRWLGSELLDDQYARLDQAGSTPDTGIALARVFIDVAASPSGQSSNEPDEAGAGEEESEEGALQLAGALRPAPGLLSTLLAVAPSPRGDVALSRHAEESEGPTLESEMRRHLARAAWRWGMQHERSGRFLIIGGPGQGKSTLVQHLCQLHRAELLHGRAERLSGPQRQALTVVMEQAATDGPSRPAQPCLPLRIVLRDFAAWMFRGKVDSTVALLRFLAERMTRVLGNPVEPDLVRRALARIPWLLVLDGLDEVPISAGRAEVLAAVRALLEGPPGRAPHLVVATTRPQGYAGELGDFASWTLLGLSQARALACAARLVEARYPGQDTRRREIVERLTIAWNEAASRRLMRTPLQVSIMTALVAQVGRAPTDRWRLFSDYYRVMYQREVERPNLAQAELLRGLRRQIDEIHRLAGLWLQTRSEQAGETDALLSQEELARLIDAVLERNGHDDGDERRALVQQIFEAAVERLVFLVHAQEGKYGFEIRSLQELMAAEALLTGGDAQVTQRLRHIAPLDAWRNVLLFAAGKCFAETWHLAPLIVHEICPWLNEGQGDAAVGRVLTGSEIALDLIEDGAARNQPRLARSLASLALRLLELPPSPVHSRLAVVGYFELEGALRQGVEARLDLPDAGHRLSAWAVLAQLADLGVSWAVDVASARWPADGPGRRDIVEATNKADVAAGRWLQGRMAEALGDFPPGFMKGVALDASPDMPLGWLAEARPDDNHPVTGKEYALLVDGKATGVDIEVPFSRSAAWGLRSLRSLQDPPSAWLPLVVAARFVVSPSAEKLAEGLDALAEAHDPAAWATLRGELPWPLAQALAEARNPEALRALAQRLRSGACGDQADWAAAERAWEKGIALESLLAIESTWPTKEDHEIGFPIGTAWITWPSDVPWYRSFLDNAVAAYRRASPQRQALLGQVLERLLSAFWGLRRAAPGALLPEELRALWENNGNPLWLRVVCALVPESSDAEPWRTLLDDVGKAVTPKGQFRATPDDLGRIAHWHVQNPSLVGLLRILVRASTSSLFGFVLRRDDMNVPAPVHAIEPARYPAGSPARFHAALLRVFAEPEASDTSSWFAMLASSVPSDPEEAAVAARYFGTNFRGKSLAAPTQLAEWLDLLPAHAWRLGSAAVEALLAHRKQRMSALEDPAVWTRLDLPEPAPARRVSSRPPPRLLHAPIDAIQISNLRAFDTLDLPIPAPAEGRTSGRWITLLGENGTGKTTILRAVALALTDPSLATTIVKASPAPYLSHDAQEGLVRVDASGRSFSARISRATAGSEEMTGSPAQERPLLFAYGCRRGSALGGAARAVSFKPYDAIATLFEEGASLIHAETWLKERALAAKEKDAVAAKALFESIRQALVRMLPGVKRIDVKAEGVWLEGPAVGRTTLEGLSDGYVSTMGWVVDLIARWIDHKDRAGEEIGPDIFEEMEGIVLVDEIDLHLHPRWQVRVIDDIRSLLPRMTFVVTTHNPLTLLGARDGEVIVLRRSEIEVDGDDTSAPVSPRDRTRIEAFQQDIPPGLTVDQVLTGAWFGLASTLDKDTLKLLEQHRTLLRDGAGRDDPRRLTLESELRQRLGGFADTSLERMAQSVAAQVLPERTANLGPERRERLKRRILETVAAEAAGAEAASPPGLSGKQA